MTIIPNTIAAGNTHHVFSVSTEPMPTSAITGTAPIAVQMSINGIHGMRVIHAT